MKFSESEAVNKHIDRLKNSLKNFQPDDSDLINEALEFAALAHSGQERISGEAYICHPIRIASRCAEYSLDADTVIVALLHDVIEDTRFDVEAIEDKFGKSVAQMVLALTKVKASPNLTMRRIFKLGYKDFRVLIVKLFDRLDNLEDLTCLPKHKQRRIIRETLFIYSDIAMGLGLADIHDEMRDKCFKILYRLSYQKLQKKLDKLYNLQKSFLYRGLGKIKEALGRLEDIEADIILKKSLHLMYERKDPDMILNRYLIKTHDKIDCYTIVGLLHSEFSAVPLSFRDYISNPTTNGRQALETMIVLEGHQIRIEITTFDAHLTNRLGVINLLSTGVYHANDYRRFLDVYFEASESDLRIEDIIRGAPTHNIQVFSPDGDCYEMRHGSTVLDFAFAVHSKLGLNCKGGIINNSLCPINRKLIDGDLVHIQTDKKIWPDESWRKIVQTPKGKKELLKYFKKQETDSIN